MRSLKRIPNLELTMALETESGTKQCTAAIACFAATEAEARETLQTVARSAPPDLEVSADRSGPITFNDLYAGSLTSIHCVSPQTTSDDSAARGRRAFRRGLAACAVAEDCRDRELPGRPRRAPEAACSSTGTAYLLWMAAWDDPAQDDANIRWSLATTDELQPYTVGVLRERV
jgi:hypothetical protein